MEHNWVIDAAHCPDPANGFFCFWFMEEYATALDTLEKQMSNA